ncbi:MAG: hypothetical protein HQL26_07905 [Candidatus Omnitrophica bacterium]|nr:hypothetical protein [Candidatus Omnitrophota bacterium]
MISILPLSYFVFLVLFIAGLGMYKCKEWARKLYLILVTFVGIAYILKL